MKTLSLKTKIYLFITYLAGVLVFASEITKLDVLKDLWLVIVLSVLASLTLIFKVEGSTNRSHYTFNFLIYGFTFALLGTSDALVVILVSNIVEWLWNKQAWYIQLFNVSSYFLAMEAAGLAYFWLNPTDLHNTWQTALSILISMALFNLLNHLMVAVVISFARGESFSESGVFEFFSIMLDLSLLYFGASLSFVWNYNPFALVLFLIPLYLIYSTLRVPALERKTEIDSKTTLFNHEYFVQHLNNELIRANRSRQPLTVIMADLDLLRNINNTYGHLAGDEVLIGVAKALKKGVREYDIVSRFGGEEFAILLPEANLSQAYERAEVLRKTIQDMKFNVPTSVTPISVTMSFGIAEYEYQGQTHDELIHNADTALYHSKLSGRNRASLYSRTAYNNFLIPGVDEGSTSIPIRNDDEQAFQSSPIVSQPPQQEDHKTDTTAPERTSASKKSVNIFIGLILLVSLASFFAVSIWMGNAKNQYYSSDWFAMFVVFTLIVLSEWFSLDLYFQKTSVSTSAIPLLVAFLLFGPIGTIFASLIFAITCLIKFHSRFNNFIFNFSNHLLAGVICLGLQLWLGKDLLQMSPVEQILLCLGCAAILYITTTSMIAWVMHLDLHQPIRQIWKEQYSWMAPLYAGVGLMAIILIFGYRYDNVIGMSLMVIPMVLLRVSQKQYLDRTREAVNELREKNQTLKVASDEIAELNEELLGTFSEIIDLRDPSVLGHSKQVSFFATEIAKIMKLNERQVELVRKGGLLHDVGKLGIPEEILAKPAKLTDDEYDNVKRHAALGAELLKKSHSLKQLIPIIRHHHEYYNGKGYPDQLTGNDISIEARIVAVSDAIEAMSSDRPYRKGLKSEMVKDEIKKNAGSQFDPDVVVAALKMLDSQKEKNLSLEIRTEPLSAPNNSIQSSW